MTQPSKFMTQILKILSLESRWYLCASWESANDFYSYLIGNEVHKNSHCTNQACNETQLSLRTVAAEVADGRMHMDAIAAVAIPPDQLPRARDWEMLGSCS
jgi:hypothetical protein